MSNYSTPKIKRSFMNKNVVLIFMVPAIFAAHYGWYKLQSVDALVSAKDRENLPGPLSKLLSAHKE